MMQAAASDASSSEPATGNQSQQEYNFKQAEPYAPPRFEAGDPKAKEYFFEYGHVVIKEVISPEEREHAVGLFWDLVEAQKPLKRDEPSTWNDYWIAGPMDGIMTAYGIGQSPFLWYTRTLPKVKAAFAGLWGDDDLLVSFDGCGVFRPPEYNWRWKTNGGWYHIDQNVYSKPGLAAIQGIVNFFPSGPHDGGFVCVPKSPKMINAMFAKYDDVCHKSAPHFINMRADFKYWKEARDAVERTPETKYDLLPVKIVLEAGDMCLWDSRTIHCSQPADRLDESLVALKRLKRLVAYISMAPASHVPEAELAEFIKQRIYAFHKGITTTHWPTELNPTWVPRDLPKFPPTGAAHVKLTPEQSCLITGKKQACDVYDEKIIEGVSI